MPYAPKDCARCGTEFAREFPAQKYCSKRCKDEARAEYLRDYYDKKLEKQWQD